ncbi:MAG: DUF721 domain-containing protein [Halocynthiibacter sp.]
MKATTPYKRRSRGFKRTGSLVEKQIRQAGEKRGFPMTKLLTHWDDIIGADIARIARPIKTTYGRGALGATLTLLTTGANAPILQAQTPVIIERVNACYGYRAISKIHVTQTAPTGFSEGKVAFEHAPKPKKIGFAPDVVATAKDTTQNVGDTSLREALERLGSNVITRNQTK